MRDGPWNERARHTRATTGTEHIHGRFEICEENWGAGTEVVRAEDLFTIQGLGFSVLG